MWKVKIEGITGDNALSNRGNFNYRISWVQYHLESNAND
jgi:hypothetical protein